MKIIDAIVNNAGESRKKEWLHIFEEAGEKNSGNHRFQFWQHYNHPVLLDTTEKYNERFNYLHWNPVKAGFVLEPWYWLYGSGVDYFTDKKGLLDIVMLEGF